MAQRHITANLGL